MIGINNCNEQNFNQDTFIIQENLFDSIELKIKIQSLLNEREANENLDDNDFCCNTDCDFEISLSQFYIEPYPMPYGAEIEDGELNGKLIIRLNADQFHVVETTFVNAIYCQFEWEHEKIIYSSTSSDDVIVYCESYYRKL